MTNNKITLTLFTVGLFSLAAMMVPGSQSAAQGVSATTIEFSAQQQQKKENKKTPQVHRGPARVQGPARMAPHVTTTTRKPAKLGTTRHKGPVTGGPKVVTPKVSRPKIGRPKAAKVFTPRGPKSRTVVLRARLRGFPAHGAGRAIIGGRNYSVWRSGYRIRHGGAWRTFVALGALSAIVIGANEFYPYAYISAPEPYCDGLTEDGCQLVWEDVETIEGDIIPQCVAYCPWQ
jgi:hypothetical protein